MPFHLTVLHRAHVRALSSGVLALLSSAVLAVDYEKEIKPLLKERCYACHGALKQKADLRLDTAAAMRKGGDNGDILAGAPSLLLQRVTTPDKSDRMPPEGEGSMLTTEQVAKLQAWLAAGSPAAAQEKPEDDPRAHWANRAANRTGWRSRGSERTGQARASGASLRYARNAAGQL